MIKYLLALVISLVCSSVANADSFFSLAKKQNKIWIQKIKKHPFNVALNQGTLKINLYEKFLYQDGYYLSVYNKLAIDAYQRLSNKEKKLFRLVDSLSKEKSVKQKSYSKLTKVNIGYTQHLMSKRKNLSVLLASMLPCQWLYQIAYQKKHHLDMANNPYQDWLSVYQSKDYQNVTNDFIKLVNHKYQLAALATKKEMIRAFNASVKYEYEFWDAIKRSTE